MLPDVFSVLPRFDFRVAVSVHSEVGGRASQQDVARVVPELALCVVADGMGGQRAGDVAARLAVEAVHDSLRQRPCQRLADAYLQSADLASRQRIFAVLRDAVAHANERVREASRAAEEFGGMGTTLDVLWLVRDRAFLAHVGDGRVYLARTRAVLQLTQDHAQSAASLVRGVTRPRRRPRGYDRLVNAVGLADEVAVDTLSVDLAAGDRLLLCTDGVHASFRREGQLGDLLRMGSVEEAAQNLVRVGMQRGNDNATAIVVAVGDRFVARTESDRGFGAADVGVARDSALLAELPLAEVLAVLAAAVEVELEPGARVGRAVTNDLVAYIVLEGIVRCEGSRQMTRGALLFPESLFGVGSRAELPVVEERVRLLRIRADDFEEVCASDPELGAHLYRRLGEHVARLAAEGHSTGAVPSLVPESGET